jgi:hypothetical protein
MSKKVLVVDDDPDVRLFSVTVLEEHGYTPLEAEDGEMGLKMIKAEKPDLVILDVLMPRQSGVRLYRELKTAKALKDFKVTKSELGAIFRNENHPKYMECGDQFLRNFLDGLIIHLRGPMPPKQEKKPNNQ